MGTDDSFPEGEVKRQGREGDHSPLSSAEVKNSGAIPPLPHVSSWHSAYLIKDRGQFYIIYIHIINSMDIIVFLDIIYLPVFMQNTMFRGRVSVSVFRWVLR
jgi:hypothetical protein